jgi:signal peptidase I
MASNDADNKSKTPKSSVHAAAAEPPQQKTGANMLETLRTILYAMLIALIVRTIAYEPFNIPSGSMIPTLLVGDYLFVSKFSYGYSRYSLPFGFPLIEGRIFEDPPKRGDVAVFKLPSDNSTDYIKRVVGLPGDRIQVRQGVLFINDQPVPRKRIADITIRTQDHRDRF